MIHVQIQIFLPPGVGVGGEWDSDVFALEGGVSKAYFGNFTMYMYQ